MNKSLEQVLKEATKDLLSEESLTAISDAFKSQVDAAVEVRLTESVDALVKERTDALVTEALVKQDADYASKLEQLLEAIDVDHSLKLEKIRDRINENHTAKLIALVEKYDKEARTEAEAFKANLVEKVSRFLDVRLNEAIPAAQFAEAVANTRSKKIIKAIREAVSLDEEFVNGEIRDALKDGKRQIDESKQMVNTLKNQVSLLTEQQQKLRTSLILEQKTSGLAKEKKDYVVRVLGKKDEKFINENFAYVVDMFEQKESDDVDDLKESTESITEKEKVDQPAVIEESKEDGDNPVNQYLDGLK